MENITNSSDNKTKELLNMFWAAAYIQEEIMWVPAEKANSDFGHYKKGYRRVLDEIKQLHKDISESLEYRIFSMVERWWNDLFALLDELVEEEFGDKSQENKDKYFAKYVQKYVDEYKEHYLNSNQG